MTVTETKTKLITTTPLAPWEAILTKATDELELRTPWGAIELDPDDIDRLHAAYEGAHSATQGLVDLAEFFQGEEPALSDWQAESLASFFLTVSS